MSTPAVQQEQLLELLLQLKKTTPDQARAILNAQPQIAYALMTVMVNINAVNVDTIQKTLSGALSMPASSASAPPTTAPPQVPTPAVAPVPPYGHMPPQVPTQPSNMQPLAMHPPAAQPPSAIPPHVAGQTSRGGTPPYVHGSTPPYVRTGTPTYGRAAPVLAPQPPMHSGQPGPYSYQGPPPVQPQPPYGAPGPMIPPSYGAPPITNAIPPALQETLVGISEEQKALIMRVLAMTPEEIQRVPPQERSNIVQLRQTLGLSS